jgi:hypothetical protein
MEDFFGVDVVCAIIGAFVAIAVNAELEENGLTADEATADLKKEITKRKMIRFDGEYWHKGLENCFRWSISYHTGSICKGGSFNYNVRRKRDVRFRG